MKKTRKDKGITLIALIITIVVLLILALVTINAIQGDGDLIAKANYAGTKYTTESENENAYVYNSLEKMKKYFKDDNATGRLLHYNINGDIYITFSEKYKMIIANNIKDQTIPSWIYIGGAYFVTDNGDGTYTAAKMGTIFNPVTNEAIVSGTTYTPIEILQGNLFEFYNKDIKDANADQIFLYEGIYYCNDDGSKMIVIYNSGYTEIGINVYIEKQFDPASSIDISTAAGNNNTSEFATVLSNEGYSYDVTNQKQFIYNSKTYNLIEEF